MGLVRWVLWKYGEMFVKFTEGRWEDMDGGAYPEEAQDVCMETIAFSSAVEECDEDSKMAEPFPHFTQIAEE